MKTVRKYFGIYVFNMNNKILENGIKIPTEKVDIMTIKNKLTIIIDHLLFEQGKIQTRIRHRV